MKKILLLCIALLGAICLGGTTYNVRLGDTLESIAQAHGIPVEDLAEIIILTRPIILFGWGSS